MFRRRRDNPGSNPDSRGASAPSFLRAASDSAWLAKDRLATGLGTGSRRLFDAFKWPFERISFALQRGLVWPLEDRAATAGGSTRALGFGAVVLLAVAAGVGGLVWAAPDSPDRSVVTEVATEASQPLATVKAVPPKPAGPTLHGAAPVFKPAATGRAADVEAAKPRQAAPSDPSTAATSSGEAAAAASTSKAKTVEDSTAPGPPAGPEAIAVARDFAGAFVLYETGNSDGGVRKAFGESASPQLSRSLMRRPPRLPANVTVPEAKVVNVVAAPSHGDVYPVSVSLLRVGVTSELRLEMEDLKGSGWQVTNVLG
jgi:hypothetical protein